jgi:hypothetical protein
MARLLAETPRDQEGIDSFMDQKLTIPSSPYSVLRKLKKNSFIREMPALITGKELHPG